MLLFSLVVVVVFSSFVGGLLGGFVFRAGELFQKEKERERNRFK